MIFEFINPSDPYHFETDNFEVAAVATFILGRGSGAAQEIDPNKDSTLLKVPIFIFGGEEEWTKKIFNMTLAELLHHVNVEHRTELINCLESFAIGKYNDYMEFQEEMKKIVITKQKESYRLKRHKQKLTSMNDFGKYAWAFAKELKKSEV